MRSLITKTAFALAASGLTLSAVPAAAADFGAANHRPVVVSGQDAAAYGDRWDRRGRNDRRYRDGGYRNYDEPVYRNSQVWQGRDGRQYCRKSDGTTGLIVGAAAGALLGREVDSRGDRTVGIVLGAAAGALLGKKVDSGTRCR